MDGQEHNKVNWANPFDSLFPLLNYFTIYMFLILSFFKLLISH